MSNADAAPTCRCLACHGDGVTGDVNRDGDPIECRSCFGHGRVVVALATGEELLVAWEEQALTARAVVAELRRRGESAESSECWRQIARYEPEAFAADAA